MVKLSVVVKNYMNEMLDLDHYYTLSFVRLLIHHNPDLTVSVTDAYLDWMWNQWKNNQSGASYSDWGSF